MKRVRLSRKLAMWAGAAMVAARWAGRPRRHRASCGPTTSGISPSASRTCSGSATCPWVRSGSCAPRLDSRPPSSARARRWRSVAGKPLFNGLTALGCSDPRGHDELRDVEAVDGVPSRCRAVAVRGSRIRSSASTWASSSSPCRLWSCSPDGSPGCAVLGDARDRRDRVRLHAPGHDRRAEGRLVAAQEESVDSRRALVLTAAANYVLVDLAAELLDRRDALRRRLVRRRPRAAARLRHPRAARGRRRGHPVRDGGSKRFKPAADRLRRLGDCGGSARQRVAVTRADLRRDAERGFA